MSETGLWKEQLKQAVDNCLKLCDENEELKKQIESDRKKLLHQRSIIIYYYQKLESNEDFIYDINKLINELIIEKYKQQYNELEKNICDIDNELDFIINIHDIL